MKPLFSVVMATYGRGRHILPSVQSVLGQTLADFELLVVGDASKDETEFVVSGLEDPRVRWLNLDQRVGSQSGPNNAGIAIARGDLIAYLGHDDIWEPDHLERLSEVFGMGLADFVVSGVLLHPPSGTDLFEVMGLFPDGTDVSGFFFPPSAFSHRRQIVDRIGGWRMPKEIRAPVDDDLLQRAHAAKLCFQSTGKVTVHKFTAAQRYLSYLSQTSEEQSLMLQNVHQEGHAARVAALIEAARAAGRFMVPVRKEYISLAPGELYRQSVERRGLQRIELRPLQEGAEVFHRVEGENLDWKERPVLGFRKNRLNPRPRLLVPIIGGRSKLRFIATCRDAGALGPIAMICNGVPVVARPGRCWFGLIAWFARYEAEITLRPDAPTVLELQLTDAQRPIPRRRRLAVGTLHLRPL